MRRVPPPLTAALALCALAAVLALFFPQPLFPHHLRSGAFDLWSDRPIPPNAGSVLADAERRIARSELYTPGQRFRVFVCNDNWKLAAYSLRFSGRMGGVADYLITRNIFLRESDIATNRLIPPSGWTGSMRDRPLSYYIAHEATHVMESRAFGRTMALRHPAWLVEGYADYVGKAGDFDFARNRADLIAGRRELDPKKSGLYRLYHLQVAWLLDHEGRSVRQLFRSPPDGAAVIEAITRRGG